MDRDARESDETPEDRVAALTAAEAHRALVAVVASILAEKSTRRVPDVLHGHRLLSRFETFDCDHAWDLKFDEGLAAAARAFDG